MDEVRLRGSKINLGNDENKLSEFDTQTNEIFEKLKNAKNNDLEDLVYRMQLTYDEVIDILDLKYIPTKRISYSLKHNIYQISDINSTLKIFYPIM